MEILVKREDMLKAMQVCGRFNSGSNVISVMNHFLCTPKGEYLTFVSTDAKRRATTYVKTEKIEAPEKFTLPIDDSITIFSKIPDEMVSIKITGTTIDIKGVKAKFALTSLDPETFPIALDFTAKAEVKLDAAVFFKSVSRVLFSVATANDRPVLCGCLLAFTGEAIDIVTTDGKRMSISSLPFKLDGEPIKIICPVDTLAALSKTLTGEVTMSVADKVVKFRTDLVECYSSLIDGEFPDYMRFSNLKFSNTAKTKTSDFKKVIDIVGVAIDKSQPVIKFSAKANQMTVSAVSKNSQAEDSIDIEFDGDVSMMFNAVFINQCLKVCDFENLFIKVNSGITPIEISGDNYRYIVMPFK